MKSVGLFRTTGEEHRGGGKERTRERERDRRGSERVSSKSTRRMSEYAPLRTDDGGEGDARSAPHPEAGTPSRAALRERVEAAVELKPGAEAPPESLIAFVKQTLDSIKAPKSVAIMVDLPRSAIGKVGRAEAKHAALAARVAVTR